jgi:GTP:adenosylcobinamide-phosphate guanylyltransferase
MVSMHSTAKSANHKLRLPPNRFIHGLSPCPEGIAVIRSDHTSSFEIIIYTPDLKVLPRPRGTYPKDLTAIATDLEEGWLLAGSVEGDLLLLDAESLRVVDQRNHLWHTPVYTLATCEMGYAVAGASDGRLMLIELLIY